MQVSKNFEVNAGLLQKCESTKCFFEPIWNSIGPFDVLIQLDSKA